MNIKPLIVKSYLESLTEENELNRIFPILLSSLGFEILSKPTENKGLPEYGKDIVAVGKDSNGIKKRFYFELKGGNDKDITTTTLNKKDGVIESLREAKFKKFSTTFRGFDSLPLKIVLVHNGVLKGNVREVFEGFINTEFPKNKNIEFDRWGIERLSIKFSNDLFGAFLLTDQKTTKLFNKVLINLNASNHISKDYFDLLNILIEKEKWTGYKKNLQRRWILLFETLKLISFVIYTEAKEYNNFDISKRYLTHLVIRYWYWILKNKLEEDKKVIEYFTQVFNFYFSVLIEYLHRTLPIARIVNGLSSEHSGRYEQIGYTKRTFEYLEFLCFVLNVDKYQNPKFDKEVAKQFLSVIGTNSVSCRPLVDINSIPIIDILNLLIFIEDKQSAINYLTSILGYLINGKEKYNRMPDANNDYESVIRFTVTGEKPIYYSDSTSPLLAVLMEYIAILNLKQEYYNVREFIIENKIDLGIFTPHHGINSKSKHLIENTEEDLEEQLFSNPRFNDGYQHEISLFKDLREELSFEDFKTELLNRKDEFHYDYRTTKAGFPFLKDLAHIYFQIPYFPDKWRGELNS
jgi:hypothetical protein